MNGYTLTGDGYAVYGTATPTVYVVTPYTSRSNLPARAFEAVPLPLADDAALARKRRAASRAAILPSTVGAARRCDSRLTIRPTRRGIRATDLLGVRNFAKR